MSQHAQPSDDWPRTSRVLPWLLAGFLAMVFLVPFDSIEAPFSIGVDAKLDRAAIFVIVVCWIASLTGGGPAGARLRPNGVYAAVSIFFAVALLSVVANVGVLTNLAEISLAVKKLVLLFSYVAFFAVVATTVRPTELRAFSKYVVILACLMSVGVIYEFRTGFNVFYEWSSQLLPGFSVLPEPPDPDVGATTIVGPTQHGLAITALLAMSLPFALTNLLREEDRGRWKWMLATGLILIATAATQKKAALAVPPVVLGAMMLYRPREILRLAPLGLLAVVAMLAVTPGALGTIKSRVSGAEQTDASTLGRTRDYDAIGPDVVTHPLIGRGYGSYDPGKYRILDNDYLGLLIETGVLGLIAFFGMLGAVAYAAHGPIRSRDPVRGPPALAAFGAAVAFGTVTIMFDSLSFAQAPYMFFFVAGVAAVCAVPGLGWAPAPTPREARGVA
jgi:O-antigen ligase